MPLGLTLTITQNPKFLGKVSKFHQNIYNWTVIKTTFCPGAYFHAMSCIQSDNGVKDSILCNKLIMQKVYKADVASICNSLSALPAHWQWKWSTFTTSK